MVRFVRSVICCGPWACDVRVMGMVIVMVRRLGLWDLGAWVLEGKWRDRWYLEEGVRWGDTEGRMGWRGVGGGY
jgi:hypothetical protein